MATNPLATTLPQLQNIKRLLTRDGNAAAAPGNPLARDKVQLGQDEHQLTKAVSQLTHAVHQFAQAGAVEAAQRAVDSHRLLVTSGIALAIVTVLALLAGWFISGRMLRPIRTITRTAQRISSSNLHERLALNGPEDELKELGDTLDDLFGRLDDAFEAQRRFVANASHELRTPLTVERTLLQVALDDPDTTNAAWRSTAKEVLVYSDEQTRLIEALLTLAAATAGSMVTSLSTSPTSSYRRWSTSNPRPTDGRSASRHQRSQLHSMAIPYSSNDWWPTFSVTQYDTMWSAVVSTSRPRYSTVTP